MVSQGEMMRSGDHCGGILDLWEPTAVHTLTTMHAVCVLGVELEVRACRPAGRGGDFYVLEAAQLEDPPVGRPAGLLVIEVDRNRVLPARMIDHRVGGR